MYGASDGESEKLWASMGIPPEHWSKMRESVAIEVWPEHWTAYQVFLAMGTQWRIGPSGPTGLEYQSLPIVMEMLDVDQAERAELFGQIRVMEYEALSVMNERKAD